MQNHLNENEQLENPLWREGAIYKALPTNSEYGDGVGVLLQEICTQIPDCNVLIVNLDRAGMLRFFAEETEGFSSLIRSSVQRHGRNGLQTEDSQPYVAWYEVRWEGRSYEVALPPGYGASAALCLGEDEAGLHRFVEAMSAYALRPEKRCLQFSAAWRSAPDLDAEIGRVTWDDVVLPEMTLTSLRDAVEGFFANRQMFSALGFAWRRGILLIGPPGTGKTMVCKAAAAALPNLPFLYVRDLRGTRGQEPVKAIFERARRLAPCILAFEDIDGFVDESNRTVFLNELDGFQNNEGLLIIASSNHPGKIDEALLKRPSRFDRVFHLGLPESAERKEYCSRVLSRSTLTERLDPSVDWDRLAQQVADQSKGFTPAYLKEVFVSAALQQAQQGADHLDQRFADSVLVQVEQLRQHLQKMQNPDALSEIPSGTTSMGLRRGS